MTRPNIARLREGCDLAAKMLKEAEGLRYSDEASIFHEDRDGADQKNFAREYLQRLIDDKQGYLLEGFSAVLSHVLANGRELRSEQVASLKLRDIVGP
jgi:hypothetical protein